MAREYLTRFSGGAVHAGPGLHPLPAAPRGHRRGWGPGVTLVDSAEATAEAPRRCSPRRACSRAGGAGHAPLLRDRRARALQRRRRALPGTGDPRRGAGGHHVRVSARGGDGRSRAPSTSFQTGGCSAGCGTGAPELVIDGARSASARPEPTDRAGGRLHRGEDVPRMGQQGLARGQEPHAARVRSNSGAPSSSSSARMWRLIGGWVRKRRLAARPDVALFGDGHEGLDLGEAHGAGG